MAKVTEAELQIRVNEVYELCLENRTHSEILTHGKKWGVTTRTIDEYIKKAKTKIASLSSDKVEAKRELYLANLWKLFQESKEDSKERHKLILSMAKLSGLDKIHLAVNVESREFKNLSNEDLANIIQEEDETNS